MHSFSRSTLFFLGVFVCVVLPVNLAGHFWELSWVNYISKPLLMPLLMGVVALELNSSRIKHLLLGALFFSWVGDVVLLFDAQFPILFLVGLGAFFIAHILYVYIFISSSQKLVYTTTQRLLFFALSVIYTSGLIGILWEHLGELRLPVVAYAMVLLTMGISSAARPKTANYLWVVLGASLFVASDSLLAINKFVFPVWKSGVWIMSTYALAQLLITVGLTQTSAKAR